tara:strand:- start:877 stop:1023 length:147 start_codon:yes stop_codon:yes gene_type:complete
MSRIPLTVVIFYILINLIKTDKKEESYSLKKWEYFSLIISGGTVIPSS